MSREDAVEFEGVVMEVLSGGLFKVEIAEGNVILAHLSGKMRKFRIRIVLGDQVTVAVSPYDLSRGRVVYRHK